jgi:hypothetical protein
MAMRKGNPFVENLVCGCDNTNNGSKIKSLSFARRNDEATADYAFLLAIATLSLAMTKGNSNLYLLINSNLPSASRRIMVDGFLISMLCWSMSTT